MRPFPFLISRWTAVLSLVAGTLFASDLHADINLPSVPPAQPEAATVKLFLGESVEIPLKGLSRSGGQLQFLIRRQPSSGTLSEIKLTSRNSASVTYTHNASTGAGVDKFRYAVRSPEGGFSTPAEITLDIVERPAVFKAPSRLEFPRVAVGQSATQSFEIQNAGGGRLEGKLSVPAPWSLRGEGTYSLGPGESGEFTVTFTPTDSRGFAGLGTFSHAEGVEIGLSGTGYAPIEVVPREIRLEGDGRSEVRTGGFVVRNISAQDRELTISAPKEVIVQDSVKVPANSETQVALHTRAGFLAALDSWVKLAGGDVHLDVPMRVMPAPARLRIEPTSLDLGSFPAGQFGRAELTIRNVGGSPAALRVTLPEGVELQPDPSYEALAPGTAREFKVSFARPGAGKLDATMDFESEGVPISIPIKAAVTEEARWPTDANSSAANIMAKLNSIPPVEQVGMVQTRTSIELSWRKPSADAVRYGVVMRTMSVGPGGDPVFKYQMLPRVKPRVIRDEVRATLEGLRPGERITLLIIAYDAEGKPSAPSLPFVVSSQPDPPRSIPWGWLSGLAIVVFAGLIVRERRRQRGVTVEEIEKIYRT